MKRIAPGQFRHRRYGRLLRRRQDSFSTLVIVSEMTGNYSLLLPTHWVCTLAFLLPTSNQFTAPKR
jgi:hypothetical protein